MAANAQTEPATVEWERELSTLVALLSNASLSSDTVASLHALLHAHQTYYKALVNPKGPNDNDKSKVSSLKVRFRGRERAIPKELADEALSLSALLPCNELDALELLSRAAHDASPGTSSAMLKEAATLLYWRERSALGATLVLLSREVLDQRLPVEVNRALVESVAALLNANLIDDICTRLKALFASDHDEARAERRALCDTLATLSYTFALSAADARRVLSLLKHVDANPPPVTSTGVDIVAADACVLLCAVLSSMDASHLLLDPSAPSSHTSASLTALSESECQLAVSSHSALLSLARHVAHQGAVDAAGWNALQSVAATLAASTSASSSSVRAQQLGVLGDVCMAHLNGAEGRVKKARHSSPESYDAMLRAMATLYEALPSEYARPWWQDDINDDTLRLEWFLGYAIASITPQTFVSCVSLLRALSQSPELADLTHSALRGEAGARPFSWTFFLGALHNVAQELSAATSTPANANVNAAPGTAEEVSLARTIPPEELQYLRTMVQLMSRVLSQSAAARDFLATEASLGALDTLFALLRCALPLELKADVVRAIAAFAVSPQYARPLWEYLEEAQIIPAPTTSAVKEGLRYELYEIEARTGSYGYSEAVLALLDALVRVLVPPMLGEGFRAPGIAPYVSFVLDDILLPLQQRSYTHIAQKHRLAALALGIVDVLLAAYNAEAAKEDLAPRKMLTIALDKDKTVQVESARSAGFTLLTRLLESYQPSSASLFGAVFAQIEAALSAVHRSDAALLHDAQGLPLALERALSVLCDALQHERWFMRLNHSSAAPASVWPLARVLLHDEGRVLALVRVLDCHAVWRDTHAARLVLQILRVLAAQPEAHVRLVTVLLAHGMQRRVLAALTSLLRAPSSSLDEDSLAASALSSTKLALVALLSDALAAPAPNLAQLLLGFDVARVAVSDLSSLAASVHVLRALLELLADDTLALRSPPLALALYSLVQLLVSHAQCGVPVQRYLRRAEVDYVGHHLRVLAALPPRGVLSAEELAPLLECRAVFLRSVARMLFDAAEQRAYRELVTRLLFDDGGAEDTRMRLLALLDVTDAEPAHAPHVHAHASDAQRAAVARATTDTPHGARVDLETLAAELDSADMGTREALLHLAVARNAETALVAAQVHVVQSWREVVAVSERLPSSLSSASDPTVPLALLESVLQRLHAPSAAPSLREELSVCAAWLVAALVSARALADVPVQQLLETLQQLLRALLRVDVTLATRAALGTALLRLLALTHASEALLLDDARAEQVRALRRGSAQAVLRCGVRLLDVVAADARDAPPEWRAVACALLDALLGLDDSLTRALLPALDQRGYVHALLADLVQRSAVLLRVQEAHTHQELRVYEATLALLLRLALSEHGARVLLASHVLEALDACAFLAVHPDDAALTLDDDLDDANGNAPSSEQLLRQRLSALLGPVLRLVAQLLATLRVHVEAHSQCLAWLSRRQDLLATLLRDRRALHSLAGLEQTATLWRLLRLVAPSMIPRLATPLLQLITRGALHADKWRSRVLPANAEERALAATAQPLSEASQPATAFSAAVAVALRHVLHVALDALARIFFSAQPRAPLFAPSLHAAATVTRAGGGSASGALRLLGEYESLDARTLRSPPLTALVLLVHESLDDLAALRATQTKCREELDQPAATPANAASTASSSSTGTSSSSSSSSLVSEASPLQQLAERRRALEAMAVSAQQEAALAQTMLEQSAALLEGHLALHLRHAAPSDAQVAQALAKETRDALSAPGGVLERLREATRSDEAEDALLAALTQRLSEYVR